MGYKIIENDAYLESIAEEILKDYKDDDFGQKESDKARVIVNKKGGLRLADESENKNNEQIRTEENMGSPEKSNRDKKAQNKYDLMMENLKRKKFKK